MKKWLKNLVGLAAVGTAAAGALYYWKKNMVDTDEFVDDFDDDDFDFDLDNDLKPVTDREYVPLNKTPETTETEETTEETED